MMNWLKKLLSVLLIITYVTVITPVAAFGKNPDETGIYTMNNDATTVCVSGKNGGFSVDTEEGSKLIKSDNNKRLLYHNGDFDTSFTSFQVTYPDNRVKEYIFGGDYSFLSLGGNNLTTTQDAAGITSEWTVDGLTFTQRIQLANMGSNEHGMVILSYRVSSAREDTVSIKQRLLLDSALGSQDYAFYEIMDNNNTMRQIENEQTIQTQDFIPLAFFGYDDPNAPGITAYTVNNAASMPYRVTFAHWNNLAATAFDYTPNPEMNFTSRNNLLYQTADSAYALYYDMGSVAPGGEGSLVSTNYGVYSNESAQDAGEVALNVVSPLSLDLSADRKTYQKADPSLPGIATFGIQAQIENFTSDTAKNYEKVTVAFYPANGITPLDNSGEVLIPAPSYTDPFTVDIMDFKIGKTQTASFYFQAEVGSSTAYRKVEMRIFDTGSSTVGSGNGLVQENLIGSHTFYVLCPGGEGSLPKVTFTGEKPEILYYKGIRHLYITGGNLELLDGDKSQYSLCAYNTANAAVKYLIPSNNILFPEQNVIDVVITEEMVPGTYELRFELTENFADALGCERVLTAPALQVVISDSREYQFTYYGILAVVQSDTGSNAKYEIKSYTTEETFEQDKINYNEILLVFRGDFTREADSYGGYAYKAVSGKKGENTVTINNCIDFQEGVISVYTHYEGGSAKSIYVDFDGSLYTSVEGSSIWKGKAAFTEIENGNEYGLIPYNKNGVRLSNFTQKPIMLIWPDVYGMGQTLAGMVFKLTYGALGIMYDTAGGDLSMLSPSTPVLGHTLSFSAMLDLGFLIPKSQKAKDSGGRSINPGTELYWISQNPKGELRGLWNHYYEETKKQKSQTGKEFTKGQASAYVDDVLFGCGVGFIGVNFKVNLALPAYVESMPSLDGVLSVNTIGDWSFGVKGKCQFTTITLEADLQIKSYKNIPVPDKIYLYVEGFEPGINVDGFGVLWITGGGGGIDKLYDTIFLTDGIPPLKLMLSIAFDIVKVMTARADMSLSLRGIGLSVRNVKLKKTPVVLLDRLQLQFDWYPDIYLMASLDANFYYGTIRGQGYIVVIQNDKYPDGFFEAFVRGKLMIPSAIPIIGGIELARVDFGLNASKVWGAASVFSFIGISVVYYWGGDVSISTHKAAGAQPTFPDLLACNDIPVYYDEETGRTLYMRAGDNLVLAATGAPGTLNSMPRLFADAGPLVRSDADKEMHIVHVPDEGKKYVYTVSFQAESVENAKAIAAGFTIRNKNTSEAFPLELYDASLDNLSTANANVTYNDSNKTGTLGVALTRSGDFSKEWEILTPGTAADIVLFELGSLPGMSSLSVDSFNSSNRSLAASWTGTELNRLDSVSFYLTKDPTGEEAGEYIGTLTEEDDITQEGTSGSGTFTFSGSLPSGSYYLRAVFSREEVVNGVVVSDTPVDFVNTNEPTDPDSVSIANGGDLTFDVTLAGSIGASDADGYLANIYEITSGGPVATEIANMTIERDSDGLLPPITLGGSYHGFDEEGNSTVIGLEAGKTYQAGITAFNYLDENSDGQPDGIIYDNEVLSESSSLNTPAPPVITITAGEQSPFITVTGKEWRQDPSGNPILENVTTDVTKTRDVTLLVSSDMNISGSWYLDNFDYAGDFTSTDNFEIDLTGFDADGQNKLSDGSHTLNISGANAQGDGFRRTKVFTVDTQPPNLLLSSPINGSCFGEDGSLRIEGIADKEAYFTIALDGNVPEAWSSKTVSQLGGSIDSDGVFSFGINVDPGVSKHHIVITVTDTTGNSYSTSADIQNAGLSSIERLGIYANGVQYTNKNLVLSSSGSTIAAMELVAETAEHSFVIDDSRLVQWEVQTVNGSAVIDESGKLSVAPGSVGFVTAGLKVAQNGLMTASATFGA